MYLLTVVIILLSFLRIIQALSKCNGTVSKTQLCSIHDNYNKRYQNRGWDKFQLPMTVKSSVTLLDIAEINENKNTVTLQLMLKVIWHDATLRLETNNEKEYVNIPFKCNFIHSQ